MFLRSDIIRRTLMVLATVVSAVYLGYRVFFTLNLDTWYSSTASVTLLGAEAYGCFLMLLYFFSIWKLDEPTHVTPLENRKVDIYIPTYNEEPDLLRGTITAALAMDYPHEVWVLDDGDRPAVKALAERLGAKYIARGYNTHAKAGNLNHAMKITEGEFIVILDADHVAQKNFITRILGYFGDERMGFVQTPHAFYNFDNFQGTLDYDKGVYWEEGQLFYNVVQPGKNHWNAVSFCGSAAMFRRSALDEVGGVATESITEDMHTGLRMHAAGWKSLFVNERLISGQAATDITTFNTQRLRWGEGNLSIFAYDNPLTMPGLNWGQRLCYLGSMLSWTTGVQKLLLYIAPMLMLITGVAPINKLTWMLGLITGGYLVTIWITVHIVSNGYGNFLGTELTHMASFWTQIRSTWRAVFKRRFAKFVVTSKSGRQSNRMIHHIMPQCLYVIGSALAIAWAGSRYWFGFSDDFVGFAIGSLLLIMQGWFAWQVICRALKTKDNRSSWRHPLAAHVSYEVRTDEGRLITGQAITSDLNERGMGVVAFKDWQGSKRATLHLTAAGRTVTCDAHVRMARRVVNDGQYKQVDGAAWRCGLEFDNPNEETLAGMWWMAANYGVARQYDHFLFRQLEKPELSIAYWLRKEHRDRERIDLPIQLVASYSEIPTTVVTECLDERGAVALVDHPSPEGCSVAVRVETPFGPLTCASHAGAAREVVLLDRTFWLQEYLFDKLDEFNANRLDAILNGRKDDEIAGVVRLIPHESKLPVLRPATIVSGASMAAALIAVALNIWVMRDELLVLRALSSGRATVSEIASLEGMVNSLLEDPAPDETRVLQLRETMRAIGHRRAVKQLDTFLATADFNTFPGRIATAQVLDEMQRHDEAAKLLAGLLTERDKITDENTLSELLIAAARNYAHRQMPAEASELFEELTQRVEDPTKYHREYAGVLAAAGAPQQAIRLLETHGRERPDWLLLASIHSSLNQHDKAIELYLEMLEGQSIDEQWQDHEVLRALADNAAWGHKHQLALYTYRQMLSVEPDDAELQASYAKLCVWNKDYATAIAFMQPLLEADPERTELWTPYLQAIGATESATDDQMGLATYCYAERELMDRDPEFLRSLADAMDKLGQQHGVLDLMEEVLADDPQNKSLRLRLADALQANRDFDGAERYYEQLLNETAPNRAVKFERKVKNEAKADRPT